MAGASTCSGSACAAGRHGPAGSTSAATATCTDAGAVTVVAYKGYEYRILDGTAPTDTSYGCQSEYLALPDGGWSLAEDNADAVAVTAAYHWGTALVVFASGESIYSTFCSEEWNMCDCAGGSCIAGTRGPNSACADGSDDVVFVEGAVYGCDGHWSAPGIGSAEGLCNTGFEICRSATSASDLGLTSSQCLNAAASGAMYVSRQSSQGNAVCSTTGSNDVFGCGKHTSRSKAHSRYSCGVFNEFITSSPGLWSGFYAPSSSRTNELNQVTHTSGPGGVMCCREARTSGGSNTANSVQLSQSGNQYKPSTCFRRILLRRPCAPGGYHGASMATYTEASTATCTLCAAGRYSSATGASSSATCTACEVGKYSSESGASAVCLLRCLLLSALHSLQTYSTYTPRAFVVRSRCMYVRAQHCALY